VNSFLTPSEKIREVVRSVIPKERLIEIYLNTPLQICEQRDNKGLYKKARKGLIKDFTGVSADFEAPSNPALTIHTGELTIQESMQIMLEFLGLQ
jgi:adenylylsulfate kinase